MARAGLGLGVRELAEAAKVSTNTITRFEAGEELRERTVDAIRAALEAAGAEFIAENGGGPGVRLRNSPPTSDELAAKIEKLDAEAEAMRPPDGPPSPAKALKTMKRAILKNEARRLKGKLERTEAAKKS